MACSSGCSAGTPAAPRSQPSSSSSFLFLLFFSFSCRDHSSPLSLVFLNLVLVQDTFCEPLTTLVYFPSLHLYQSLPSFLDALTSIPDYCATRLLTSTRHSSSSSCSFRFRFPRGWNESYYTARSQSRNSVQGRKEGRKSDFLGQIRTFSFLFIFFPCPLKKSTRSSTRPSARHAADTD